MAGLFGMPEYVKCCCGGCPDVPCDCEFSITDNTCYVGSLVSTTIPGDTCAGARVSGSTYSIPDANKKWVIGEDFAQVVLWDGFHITIPCGLMPLALVGVLVRRASSPSGPSPYIDNDLVAPCEYYFVMYTAGLASHAIYYEYELCCGESEAAPRCQTRLAWIKFTSVSAGRGVYDFLIWNKSGPNLSGGNGVLVGECPFSDGNNPCL